MKISESLRFSKLGCNRHYTESFVLDLYPQELVEVRRESEIVATLDENKSLEGLPFTPEMRKYFGKRFKVLKRVDKIVVEWAGIRRMKNTVILKGVTCNGEAHGGCRRTCPLLWKEAWLKRVHNSL